MIETELQGYFDYSLNAVFAAENEKIEYLNPAAKRLFPGVHIGDSVETLGKIGQVTRPGVFSAVICDRACDVTMATVGGAVIYTAYPLDSGDCGENREFISSVCRSMTEALAVIKMSGELMQPYVTASDNSKMQTYSATMNRSFYKLSRLVSNLAGLYDLDMAVRRERTFDIARLCADLTGTVAELISDKGIAVSYTGKEGGVSFFGDPGEIEKMLLNLLSNSIKYSSAGSKITLHLVSVGKKVTLIVSDSGSGMDAETLTDAFGRFDAEAKTTDDKAGVGMGLRLVKQIAARHGGTVMIESREALGTAVTVSMPVREQGETVLKTPTEEYNTQSMRSILTELSDVLDYTNYMAKYMD